MGFRQFEILLRGMLNREQLLKIEEETKEFFKKLTFEVDIELLFQKEQTVCVNLKTDTPQILIGERGQTLIEIQQLLSAILKRKIQEVFFIDIDINGYKKKKIEYLKEMAKTLADEAVLTKQEKWLPPMPAYERRIIHLELSERTDIATESFGQEPLRKIVIKPCS